MIVELTGIPGSGKSTLALQLATQFECQIVEGNSLFRTDIFGKGRLAGHISFAIADFRAMANATLALSESHVLRAVMVKYLQRLSQCKAPSIHRINMIRNTLLKVATQREMALSPDKLFVVDEGLTHLPQNVFVDNTQAEFDSIKNEVCELARVVPTPDILIFLDLDFTSAVERLKLRGHRRFGSESKKLSVQLERAQIVARCTVSELQRLWPNRPSTMVRVLPNDGLESENYALSQVAIAIKEIQCTR